MQANQFPEIHESTQLMRIGRYLEAAETLRHVTTKIRDRDGIADAMLADALQRIGQNAAAEALALKHLRGLPGATQFHARYHFVLGNVERDRGNTSDAIRHLQIAAGVSGDAELACWSHLRLISAVAEVSGIRTAIARLDEVKRVLTRFGDARPFVALHLWLVEAEGTRGNLEIAWRNLRTADALLSQIEDVWLRGYLAVNRSALHYYSAEIVEAREWAETAIRYADKSGHSTTRRAAHVNLGNIEFSQGRLSRAEACFNTALECSERASLSEVIILENIAQIKLHQRDFQGCKSVLAHLEELTNSYQHAKRKHYKRWALQTKIRLLLQEGKTIEARQISNELNVLARETPHARVSAASHLLSAETLLALSDPKLAADSLKPIFSPGVQLPPDLYAEMERVTGKALAMSGATDLAQVHLHRACRTFDLIGNMVGKERVIKELTPTLGGGSKNIGASTSCLDRLRVLLDLRTRAELFGHEAVVLLQELACTEKITLSREHGNNSTTILQSTSRADALGTDEMTVVINGGEHTKVTLSFVPLGDAKSVLTALTFQHVMRQILHIGQTESLVGDQEILWSTNEPTSVTSGAVFASDLMLGVLRTVKQIAPTDVSVLITGETGAGKEVVARAVHELSHRSAMPFLGLNCAAVPKDLLESQLFGHRKGAFSGAGEAHQGIVRAANGGTLFLDEIGEIPIDVQAKLLRFLEMSEVHPVGETHPVKVNVRLIFATNGDLEEAVRQNRFRQDLFYRLNVIPIKVPALRERREEIPVLANVFAQRFATEFGKEPLRFSSSAMELLILYTWPGNIRQLANEVRRLTALTESGACITPDHLSPQLQAQTTQIDAAPGVPQMQVRIDQPLEKATAHLEAEMIKHALRQAGGRVTAAASTLGISRKGLYLKRLRLGLRDFNERAS